MKAIASPAADNTQPVLSAVTRMAVPMPADDAADHLPGEAQRGARAVGRALEHPHGAGGRGFDRHQRERRRQPTSSTTGAATDTATGSSDSALASDALD